MKQSGSKEIPRRRFLQQLMVLGSATSTGVIALQATQAEMSNGSATNPHAGSTTPSRGYRLTRHIRTYYEKAQI